MHLAHLKNTGGRSTEELRTYLRLKPEDYGVDSRMATCSVKYGEDHYRFKQTLSADAIVIQINELGGVAATYEMDLSRFSVINSLFDIVEDSLGPVDILVNNAAYCSPDTFKTTDELSRAVDGANMQTITPMSIEKHFAVNTHAPALLMAEYAQRFILRKATWGSVINISTDGASCFPTEISYGASKHALESYSRSFAVEMGPYGITCNTLSLGMVQTGWITPENVADAIIFLASDQARWITGQLLYIGGGHVMPL